MKYEEAKEIVRKHEKVVNQKKYKEKGYHEYEIYDRFAIGKSKWLKKWESNI